MSSSTPIRTTSSDTWARAGPARRVAPSASMHRVRPTMMFLPGRSPAAVVLIHLVGPQPPCQRATTVGARRGSPRAAGPRVGTVVGADNAAGTAVRREGRPDIAMASPAAGPGMRSGPGRRPGSRLVRSPRDRRTDAAVGVARMRPERSPEPRGPAVRLPGTRRPKSVSPARAVEPEAPHARAKPMSASRSDCAAIATIRQDRRAIDRRSWGSAAPSNTSVRRRGGGRPAPSRRAIRYGPVNHAPPWRWPAPVAIL